jgi:hypothetical protein
MRAWILVRLAVSASMLGSFARAQCEDWQEGFHIAGFDSYVECMSTFDDGAGPALFAGGEGIVTIPGNPGAELATGTLQSILKQAGLRRGRTP